MTRGFTDLLLELAADVPHAAHHHLQGRTFGATQKVKLVGDEQGHVLTGPGGRKQKKKKNENKLGVPRIYHSNRGTVDIETRRLQHGPGLKTPLPIDSRPTTPHTAPISIVR